MVNLPELYPIQACTFIFLLEMILKLVAFTWRGYIKSGWNIFDGVVVVISLVDAVLTLSTEIDNTGASMLRSFRLVSSLITWSCVVRYRRRSFQTKRRYIRYTCEVRFALAFSV